MYSNGHPAAPPNGHLHNQARGPPPAWNSQSPNPQHPNGAYPPPSTQGAQPYPPPPTSSASHPYPPPTNGYHHPPPPHGSYPPSSASQPPNGVYPPPPAHMGTALPPIPPESHPDMMMQGQYPPSYRYPPSPHDQYRGAPPHHMQPYPHQAPQPAPRQRTAIACRYCRRRKIRCSGFEASEDGRCTNCVRFSQECIFTPVSAQTQAFVPAHTVRGWSNGGQQLYGAYGQPLPQSHSAPPPPQGQQVQQGYPLPSPTGPYPTPSASYSPGGSSYDDRGARDAPNSRKRSHAEPHTPTLPPPNPAVAVTQACPDHRGSHPSRPHDYAYPEPPNLTAAAVSPASSHSSYHPGGQPPQQPYYASPAPSQPQPPRRSSPGSGSNYSYDTNRTSSSPHTGAAPSTPGAAPYSYANGTAPVQAGRTPPPPTSQPGGARPSMRINDLVDNGKNRSTTDSDMLNQLNRKPM